MFYFKSADELMPTYATPLSAAADLRSSQDLILKGHERAKVPTGLFIESVDLDQVPQGMIPTLQIRARSGLAYKHGITLTNGVGTIDADYRDEICVLLLNTSSTDFEIHQGDRIAQICCQMIGRLAFQTTQDSRHGGFGSTGL